MGNLTGKLAIMLLATGALATPAYAAPPANKPAAQAAPARAGGAPHPGGAPHVGGAPHFGGGRAAFHAPAGRSFAPHVGARSFTSHVGARSFTPHVNGHAANFAHVNRGTSVNRAALRAQRLQHVTHGNVANGNVTTNALRSNTVTNNALRTNANANSLTRAQRRALRRNATGSVTPLAARQGRFASRLGARAQLRGANFAARRAWHHHQRAGFVAWYGPVFWPYAYSDIFDYAFWPGGYDDGYWDYAYDNFFDGLFWGEAGPPEDYAYAGSAPVHSRVTYAAVQELCKQPGSGITAWPFADIERKVGLSDDQKALLGDVRKAAADAAATFKASCPSEDAFPLTPPGRLTAMTARLQGTLDAVKVVRPALEKFYASLSDEQKERFNQLGPKQTANNAEASAALPQDAKSCTEAKPGLANLPIEKIADIVKPTDEQQAGLKQLQDATGKAVSVLQAACPDETPITPPGRLAAMQTRLQAMVDAAKAVKPALDSFYASLSNEQKARFDRIGQELAQNND
ncbi:MAG: Spy/CpxP family protein refolding chaperone [Pseudolabrys sp.]